MPTLEELINKPDDQVTIKDILRGMIDIRDEINQRLTVIESKIADIDEVKKDVTDLKEDLRQTKDTVASLSAAEDPFPPT